LITAINEQVVVSVDDLHRFLSEWPIGQPIRVEFVRGQDLKVLTLLPTEAASDS